MLKSCTCHAAACGLCGLIESAGQQSDAHFLCVPAATSYQSSIISCSTWDGPDASEGTCKGTHSGMSRWTKVLTTQQPVSWDARHRANASEPQMKIKPDTPAIAPLQLQLEGKLETHLQHVSSRGGSCMRQSSHHAPYILLCTSRHAATIRVSCRSVTKPMQHQSAAANAEYEDTANGSDSIADMKVHTCSISILQIGCLQEGSYSSLDTTRHASKVSHPVWWACHRLPEPDRT
jgi:hypothetical protein